MNESRSTILVIDDDHMVLNVLREHLAHAGYGVMVADSGEYGIKSAIEKKPDLVILDIAMPGMNGYEAMARIREKRDVPIIMLSGHAQLDDVLVEYDPPDSFFRKPVKWEQLLATIHYLLVPSSGL